MGRPRKSAPPVSPSRTLANVLEDGLVRHRAELPGNPDPEEIKERVQKIVLKMRFYAEMAGPLRGDERWHLLTFLATYEFFPDQIPAIQKALEPAFDIVDEAWVSVDVTNRKIDIQLMRELWRKGEEIAMRKEFQKVQAEARARLARKAGGEVSSPS